MPDPSDPLPLRRNRDFGLLWTGQAVAAVGTSMSLLVYPLLAFSATGSARMAGVVAFVGLASGALLRLPSGVLVDRVRHLRRLMVSCEMCRAVVTAQLAAAVLTGESRLAYLLAAAGANAACEVLFDAAQTVAVRHVVPSQQLPNALAQNEARGHLAGVVGQPLGGLLYGIAAGVPLVAQAAALLVSGLLISSIRNPLHTDGPRPSPVRLHRDLFTGAAVVLRHAFMRIALLCAAGFQFVFSGLTLVLIISAKEQGVAAGAIGAMFAMAAAGGVLGAVFAARIQSAVPPARLVLTFAATASAVLFLLIFVTDPYAVGALLAVTYLAATPANAMLFAVQMHMTPLELQGRVISSVMLIVGLAAPLGPLFGGWILEQHGRQTTLTILGTLAVALAIRMLLSPAIRAMRPLGAS